MGKEASKQAIEETNGQEARKQAIKDFHQPVAIKEQSKAAITSADNLQYSPP